MADTLYTQGKIEGMKGIKDTTRFATINESGGAVIASLSITDPDDFFTVDSSGTLSNTVAAMDFVITGSNITDPLTVVSYVTLLNISSVALIRIDLESTVSLTTEGTATFGATALTAIL